MSRVQLLYDLIEDLRTVADDVQAIADALTQNYDVTALPEQTKLPQPTADDPEPEDAPITKEQVRDAMEKAGIDPTRRGETLSLTEFAQLADAFSALA